MTCPARKRRLEVAHSPHVPQQLSKLPEEKRSEEEPARDAYAITRVALYIGGSPNSKEQWSF